MPRADAGRHGLARPRGQRFGRMFVIEARDPGLPAIDALATALALLGDGDENDRIPAGYTYLSQFVDHDITFDATSQLGADNDPDTLVNLRTPRLDLDSLYGSGPLDQPYLYDWGAESLGGAKLLVAAPPQRDLAARDLPRNEQGRALIGDPRNDENAIVSQLHLLFARFHNTVVDRVHAGPERLEGAAAFDRAREIVRRHYQWIVMHDLLPRLLGGPPPAKPRHDWHGEPFIPVEFSAAAYRFGHSLVRRTYVVDDVLRPDGSDHVAGILPGPKFKDEDEHLGGFRPLRAALELQWPLFFDVSPGTEPQRSLRIDEHLSKPLFRLPFALAREVVTVPVASASPPTTTQLARLNLLRGHALKLPAGPDVAAALSEPVLTRAQLFPSDGVMLADDVKDVLTTATPLWYYLLREAASLGDRGRHLGPVGGFIVSEVLIALLHADPDSYVNADPAWTPDLAPTGADFTMGDLVRLTNAAP